jgi:hypothetical protein
MNVLLGSHFALLCEQFPRRKTAVWCAVTDLFHLAPVHDHRPRARQVPLPTGLLQS